MKYRMGVCTHAKVLLAFALAVACEWVDDKVFGHAERWFPLWVPVRYPFCEWSYRLHEWTVELSGIDFLDEDEWDYV